MKLNFKDENDSLNSDNQKNQSLKVKKYFKNNNQNPKITKEA